jgi:hypothetical protein
VILSVVFVYGPEGWVTRHGPKFVSVDQATEWARETCAGLERSGLLGSVCIYSDWSKEVLYQQHAA